MAEGEIRIAWNVHRLVLWECSNGCWEADTGVEIHGSTCWSTHWAPQDWPEASRG